MIGNPLQPKKHFKISKEESLAKSSGNGGGHKSLLPSTGEVVATGLVFSGVLTLVGAVSLKRKSSRK